MTSGNYRFAQRSLGLRSSVIRDLLKLTEQSDMLSLAGGLPAADSFPLAELTEVCQSVLTDPTSMQYSSTSGIAPFRQFLAADYTPRFGRDINPDTQVIATHGSQQGLDLLAKVLIDPGDTVVVESPAYLGALQAFELYQPSFVAVPGDADGFDVDYLTTQLEDGLRPKLVYVVANFHNPTGVTLTLDRRQRLAALADEYDFVIVEDDPYGAIRFRGESPAPIAAFSERVVHLSTCSKTVAPGFRLGWLIGPPAVVEQVVRAKQATDLHTSTFTQRVITELLSRPGWLANHLDDVVEIYRQRGDALAEAFDELLGDRVVFVRPEGGMFLWANFAGYADTTELLERATRNGVAFVPGHAFTIDNAANSFARFSYATLQPAQLRLATERLVAALEQ